MNSAYSQQSNNITRTWILLTLFIGLISALFYGLAYYFNSPILIFVGIALSLGQALIAYFAGGSLAVAQAGGKEVTYEQSPQIHEMVENLARIAGIPKPKIYISPDQSANAFACGRDPEHANICINQGLLNILDKNQLEGVLAHELSHVKNRDILVSTITMVLAGVISFVADFGFRSMAFGGFGGGSKDEDSNNKSPIFFVLYIIVLILAPILSTLITLAVSRQREFLADASGVVLTRYPEGLIGALEKLYSSPIPTEHFSTATSHFYIAPPKQNFGENIQGLFSTHPSVEARVEALRKM